MAREPQIAFGTRLPIDTHQKLVALAASAGKPKTTLAREFIESAIAQMEKAPEAA